MVNVFTANKKKEPTPEEIKREDKEISSETKTSDEPAMVIQKLKAEEAQLTEEKRSLVQLKEQLQKRIKDQIENSRNSVKKLKAEVDELKIECAQLNESLQNELLVE